MKRLFLTGSILALALCHTGASWADTTITYQGRLDSGGQPYTGTVDMELELYDQEMGGNKQGPSLSESVQVIDGLFQVDLDFGAQPYQAGRWLAITVNNQLLSPRQRITGVSYSIQSRGIHVDADLNVGIGTASPQRLLDLASAETILRLSSTDNTSPVIGSRLQLKSFDSPGIFNLLGVIDFINENDTTLASIRGGKVGFAGSAILDFQVGADSPAPQLGISDTAVTVRGDGPILRLQNHFQAGSVTTFEDVPPSQLRIMKSSNFAEVMLDFDPNPENGVSPAQVRFFHETNTTGSKNVRFLRGNGTTAVSANIGVDSANSWFQAHGGNVGIGTASPNAKLQVVGSVATGNQGNISSGESSFVGGGSDNTASGFQSFVGGGSSNTASGSQSFVGGGILNVASAGTSFVGGGVANVAGANASFAAGSRAKAIHAGSFVWGDDTGADVASTGQNEFTARTTGGARFFTNGALTAGVALSSGGSAWGAVSDRNAKENFEPVETRAVLKRLAAIPVMTWNYTAQDASIRHMGPIAQDFWPAFGLGEDAMRINTINADGVAFAAIQALYEIVQEKDAEIEQLRHEHESEIAALHVRFDRLEELITQPTRIAAQHQIGVAR